MYFHLILTDECNLCCRYCRAKEFEVMEESDDETAPEIDIDPNLPRDLDFDLNLLYTFLQKDPAPTLTFYGGEPLMRADLVDRIVREAPVQQFMIQTNGLLLDQLAPEIVNRLSTILVSLDGGEDLTDGNRGMGVYRKVIENVRKIREGGYSGELIARMTVTERTDIAEAVHWLFQNPDYSFNSIHWQLDANFAGDFSRRHFAEWVNTSYNPGIRSLVADWVDRMELTGKVAKWYPFLDPMEDLLLGRKSHLRCGSGHANYSIMTDGHIAPCPAMVGMTDYYVGHIRTADPQHLDRILIAGECTGCGIYDFCGGRCLYSNITKPWNNAERKIVCGTVENLYTALKSEFPRVQRLIKNGTIAPDAFAHEKFNGCEIIP
ncbi:MAG: putative peptide-modifying radical SAM/SPASM domain-containing protein [Methanomicrobiales archaeon HGW-Methanomicrobiales-1]|jgi:putative peptide-modifying radical SAM enzyme|nr:MAG: putative peptide-modifying radical SAM/SPASM domain-containing protein [Methanomicrobiales archaeon HGW-Methanomicrobiales-1]